MSTSLKKAINIVSYLLNIVFILALIVGWLGQRGSSSVKDEIESIKSTIVERERADIPLKIQSYDRVHSITVDSLVITGYASPYAGYLVTTWDFDEKQNLTTRQWAANGYEDKYIRKQKVIYVPISDITANKKGEVFWQDNWLTAYMSIQ